MGLFLYIGTSKYYANEWSHKRKDKMDQDLQYIHDAEAQKLFNTSGWTRKTPTSLNVVVPPNFIGVVIATYMRSGSSLTGDILQQSPEAFYVYEPLRSLGHMVNKSGSDIYFVNGTVRLWPFDFRAEATNVIRNWLLCDLMKLPERVIMDGFLSKGIKSKTFRECYSIWYQITGNRTSTIRKCAVALKSVCEQSPVRIIKTIRTPIEFIRHLLDEIPGLKVVHLMRDPRATLRSQRSFGMCPLLEGGMYGCTNRFCTRVENDIIQADTLAKIHPGRLATVLYEHIASKPIETSRKMFKFIGTIFTSQAQEYIFNITSAGKPDNCGICTTRTNSSEHIYEWMEKLKPESIRIVEDRCNYIIRRYFNTSKSL